MERTEKQRCWWPGTDALYIDYHDREWGVPVHDDRRLFEFVVLEGAQAGLSWITILRKREAYRATFDGFDPEKVARYGDADRARPMADAGIIRSNAKIDAAINGAKIYLAMRDAGEDFSDFCWSFTGGKPLQNNFSAIGEVPAKTALAEEVAAALKAKGFKFVGPVIVYAWMQAVGMVNDHLVGCFRHEPCARLQASFKLPGTGTGPGSAARGAGGTARTARTPKASSRA